MSALTKRAVLCAARAIVKGFNVVLKLHPLSANRQACIYFDHPGPVIWIAWIESKAKGEGAKALTALTAFCDQHNVLLRLYVDEVDAEFLKSYYARFGFEPDPAGGGIMERPPKLAKTLATTS